MSIARFRLRLHVALAACSAVWFLTGPLGAAPYSWQLPHAAYSTNGDLLWQPQPFVYQAGASIRYIDFAAGNDANNGTSTATPWKHHPWDPAATGNAAAANGIHTYVFKRGVTYYGRLVPRDSGVAGNPIRLTSDPAWGTGEAALHASELITGSWTAGAHPKMPSTNGVYYVDLPFAPRRLWLIEGTNITRLSLARTPNWVESNPDDIKSEWWNWLTIGTTMIDGQEYFKCADTVHLTKSEDYYSNAILWTEYQIVMATPYPARVVQYDAGARALVWKGYWGDTHKPWQYNRYFLEDKPHFLDAPGEFWFDKTGEGGRLYVRLPDDRNPNGLRIEAARYMCNLDLVGDLRYVDISGLAFRFNNAYWDLTATFATHVDVVNSAIRLRGNIDHVNIQNCRFEHVSKGMRIECNGAMDRVFDITIADNEILETDHGALEVSDYGTYAGTPPLPPLDNLRILRNRIHRIGQRGFPPHCHGHAVIVNFPQTAEIAGNILSRTWGSGLFIFGGKPSGDANREIPLTRIFIHHNRLEDSLLTCNDWGGIETWQGGPFYVYNNISANPGGFWYPSHRWNIGKPASQRTFSTARLGFAFYLDGSYKNYLFNNVSWGKNNDLTSPLCNASAFYAAGSFENIYANNTVYKFGCAFGRAGDRSGRNQYLGNLHIDLSDWVYHTSTAGAITNDYDYRNLAFARNLYQELPRNFGRFERNLADYTTFTAFQTALSNRHVLSSQLGKIESASPVRDAASHDFHLDTGSSAIDYGVKSFAPWALSRVVGEWHFRCSPENPAFIQDNHWYMTPQYRNRETYYGMPRHNLAAVNVAANDYVAGPLEDWCPSALHFDGVSKYAWTRGYISDFVNLDIGTNNFLIEAYLRTVVDHTGGVICAKADTQGYSLSIDDYGRPVFQILRDGAVVYTRVGAVHVNDGVWHHLLVQVERQPGPGVSIFVDGFRTQTYSSDIVPDWSVALTNAAVFYVGRGPGGNYFAGDIDFLRVARDTLQSAKTTIDELYDWQFNGPFLRDFRGVMAYGPRDAGAFEYCPPSALPRITRQPQDVFVEPNGNTGMRIMTENATTLAWRLNGIAIPGATNERHTIMWVDQTKAGAYDVIAGNAAGSVTSTVAILQVVPEPLFAPALLITILCTIRRVQEC